MAEEPKIPKQLSEEPISETELKYSSIPPSEKQSTNMEVHHHPHVGKKSFTEYLLEGLMIFVAVSMGFVAENLREHISDREKEREYIKLLSDDLKKDTAALNYSIRRLQSDISRNDTLVVLFAKNKLKDQNDAFLSQLTLYSGLSVDIVFNDRAASQLKGSGSMRLIKHVNVTDSILQYWDNQIRLKEIHDRFENTRLEHRKAGYKIFNWYLAYYKYSDVKGINTTDSSISNLPIKAIYNDNNIIEFLNVCANLLNTGSVQYMPLLKKQLKLASQLIALLENEYHLKNE